MAFLRFLPPARSSAGSPKRCWRWSTSMNGRRNPVDLDGLWPGYHNSSLGWVGHDLRWKVSWKSGNITILRNLKSVNVKGVFQRLGLDLDWLFWKALTNDWRQNVCLIDVCFTGNLIFVFFVGGLTMFLKCSILLWTMIPIDFHMFPFIGKIVTRKHCAYDFGHEETQNLRNNHGIWHLILPETGRFETKSSPYPWFLWRLAIVAEACAASRLEAWEFLHLQRWKFGKWRSSCGTQKIGTGWGPRLR